jgi:putative sterol carrier protein
MLWARSAVPASGKEDDMGTPTRPSVRELLGDLEEIWSCLDGLLDGLEARDWGRRHGKDWVVADLPHHLAYYDRELIAGAIVRGPDVPVGERRTLRTMAELNAWNAERFAQRPTTQSPAESLAAMRASRELVRRAVAPLNDGDMSRPVWCPLPGQGWLTVGAALAMCAGHSWSHLHEARLRLGRSAPLPGASATHRALGYFGGAMLATLDREAAKRVGQFTMVLSFTGPGGGDWTLRVANGACTVAEGRDERADLMMMQSPEGLVKTMTGLQNPLLALLTGRMRVRGFRALGTFGKLFPPPQPGTVFVTPSTDLPRPLPRPLN